MNASGLITDSPIYKPDKDPHEVEYKTAKEKGSLSKDDFMMLFVTQLQYQDPMSPMESAEMASQMAQFNALDLLYKNNEAMERLAKTYENTMGLSAVSLLGHSVYYKGGTVTLNGAGEGQTLYIELDSPAASVSLEIRDASGALVNVLDIGPMSEGRSAISWDGTDMDGNPVPPGDYRMTLVAADEQGDELDSTLWTPGRVTKIEFDEHSTPLLQLESGSMVSWEEVWTIS
jgi:flagellar basal-body rod modification protein FlgD